MSAFRSRALTSVIYHGLCECLAERQRGRSAAVYMLCPCKVTKSSQCENLGIDQAAANVGRLLSAHH
eukprot:4731690-Alexandrium_andersonii.AAC.1